MMRVLIVVSLVLAISGVIFAKDYETPHRLESGQVISADVLNEVFAYIKNSARSITMTDLLGTWSFRAYDITPPSPPEGWTRSQGGLYIKLEGTITFSDDGDGTYSLSASPDDPFMLFTGSSSSSRSVSCEVLESSLGVAIEEVLFPGTAIYAMRWINETRIVCTTVADKGSSIAFLILDKQNLPPNLPTKLSATTSGLTVTLSWTDTSADETGFRILRRDSLTGTYLEIATVDADVITYTDTVTAAGKYWYRVRSTNTNGQSLGSNVVKVDVAAE